jgi:hypothetical protein
MPIASHVSLVPGFYTFRNRLEFGDFVLFPYVLTLAWQYVWVVNNRVLAWTLAAALSLCAWYVYVAYKEFTEGKTPRAFWLLVALPLLLLYSARVAFPDTSFDVLNYHILNGERALSGPLFLESDFFPTIAPFNPAPDIITGLYRHLLGYRLGTLCNYLTLVWVGTILNRLFKDYLPTALVRCIAVLFILLAEPFLFQITTYMVDLLALPLLLEATRMAVDSSKSDAAGRTTRIALLLGASVALKLPNLAFAIPITLVHALNLFLSNRAAVWRKRILSPLKKLPAAAIAFALPLAPFTLYIYKLTGSPVFYLYNGFFKSPYWPQSSVFDPRWGPKGAIETLCWPVLVFFEPNRLGELGVYSGRISLGFILAAVCLLTARGDRNIRGICFVTLLGAILWSATNGIGRYGLYLELTCGVVLIWLAWYVWKKTARFPISVRIAGQAPLWLLLLAQTGLALKYANDYEWSMRPTIFSEFRAFKRDSLYLLRDRSLPAFLGPDDLAFISEVDVWVESAYKTTAPQVLLRPNTPIIAVRFPEYFNSRESTKKFTASLAAAQGKRVFTLTDNANLPGTHQSLRTAGLVAGQMHPVSILYFSPWVKLDMLLVEVLPFWQTDDGRHGSTPRGQPLPYTAFSAGLSVSQAVSSVRAGEQIVLRVMLKNQSNVIWPGQQPEWKYQVTVGNTWFAENGARLAELDRRVVLSRDLAPGESVELPLTLTTPAQPGNYTLRIDAVQEGVAWFGDMGSEVLNLKLRVE